MNITVTESALLELRANKEQELQYYRMGVMPGGCSGFRYTLMLEETPAEDDLVIDSSDDVKLIIDPFSAQYLENAELDYVKTLTESGFKFNNPNATGGCGCGSSFSA
jgi:iron-sulfur cluster assembly accessory protein